MIKLCNSLDIKIENLMKYICIDANRASSNSISKNFVESKIIMCWFHLIANINKNSKKIPKIHQEKVVEEIRWLHSTKEDTKFDPKIKKVLKLWSSRKGLEDFVLYFKKQWIDSPFSNWQLFNRPAGFAITNNPIEQYNGKIKKIFTDRKFYNKEIPHYVNLKPKYQKKAKEHLNDVKFLGKTSEDYLQYTFNQHNIVVNPDCFCPECTSCSCCFYLHDAICYHLISCCLVDKIEYPGLFPKKFVHKTTSKKRKAGPWYEVD
ncbi:unnamed protein product [Brachionus calyciflorus]|uniref:SWIM-type domain-containing protein n=1 Tax=Brachionus calyciflorus TaxID=104777 RepID=A0A814RYX9_9BILA|nr:unnamed protein product [Brachionus calyciflorus]